ncbi:MAG: DUF4390 domain-containing protein [Desulfamplus sp.]|nr:DUF4390 domain-containing protein [Desulfamplus sp.]MBF0210176.1 DUF4390 domain-containing protein [Desulfamplus sp.]MBF0243272.1 DUF4390 domain-containing protein [Desulfamplus sp.]MBF0390848.1 DUF4390 domain-containing protein [Desulfamplus sp.]
MRQKRASLSKIFINTLISTLLLVQPFIAPAAFAKRRCSLENIVITRTRDNLIGYFNVTGAFTEKMSEAILKGVPASFAFFILVYRKQDGWFDKKVAEVNLTATLKYNSLKQDFTVLRPWKTDKPFTTTSFEQAKEMASTIYNLKIIPISELEKGEQYKILIKAEMNKATLPLYLHYVFFFISYWDFETDWYEINMLY